MTDPQKTNQKTELRKTEPQKSLAKGDKTARRSQKMKTTEPCEVFVVGDTHFKMRDYRDCMALIIKIIDEVNLVDPKFVVLLGDVYDDFGKVGSQTFVMVNDFIEKLSQGRLVYILIGNHDLNNSEANSEGNFSKNHFFGPLKKWKNVRVIDEPTIKKIHGTDFVFVPFVKPGHFLSSLDSYVPEWKRARVVFAHQDLKGFSYEEEAEEWPEDAPLIISGHIHEYSKKGNIIYTGSSRQTKINESPVKYLHFFQFEQDGSYSHQTVDTEIKGAIEVRIPYEDISTFDWNLTERNRVYLRIIGSHTQNKLFHRSEMHAKLQKAGVKVLFVSEITENPNALTKVPNLSKKSFLDILAKLADADPKTQKAFDEMYPGYVLEAEVEDDEEGDEEGGDAEEDAGIDATEDVAELESRSKGRSQDSEGDSEGEEDDEDEEDDDELDGEDEEELDGEDGEELDGEDGEELDGEDGEADLEEDDGEDEEELEGLEEEDDGEDEEELEGLEESEEDLDDEELGSEEEDLDEESEEIFDS